MKQTSVEFLNSKRRLGSPWLRVHSLVELLKPKLPKTEFEVAVRYAMADIGQRGKESLYHLSLERAIQDLMVRKGIETISQARKLILGEIEVEGIRVGYLHEIESAINRHDERINETQEEW